eukprot:scaffold40234_cov68-Phaeocystis_antarctica.AAC.11
MPGRTTRRRRGESSRKARREPPPKTRRPSPVRAEGKRSVGELTRGGQRLVRGWCGGGCRLVYMEWWGRLLGVSHNVSNVPQLVDRQLPVGYQVLPLFLEICERLVRVLEQRLQ